MPKTKDDQVRDLIHRAEDRIQELIRQSVAEHLERGEKVHAENIAADAIRATYEEFKSELDQHPAVAKFYRTDLDDYERTGK